MLKRSYGYTKAACFITSLSTAAVGNLAALLFLTFRNMYGISYTMLGSLVLINFGTQLLFDLMFSFFSHKFNIDFCTRVTPIPICLGMILFGAAPWLFPNHVYAGLVLGTVVYSMGGGLSEVLSSPTIAAIPSPDSDRLLSALHSCYAWGNVGVVAISTAIIFLAGAQYWQILPFLFAVPSFIASFLFVKAEVPSIGTAKNTSAAGGLLKNKFVFLSVLAIFLGGAAECGMAQWCSTYIEQALGISKIWGDLFGVAAFALMLGLGRTLYAKFGKNIEKILLIGAIGATLCYLIAIVSPNPVIGLLACALTGFCVSMLWPGSLMLSSSHVPDGGVAVYAMMAAGGDLGAAAIAQIMGIISDQVLYHEDTLGNTAVKLNLTMDQLSMKAAMACAMMTPLLAIAVYFYFYKKRVVVSETKEEQEVTVEKIPEERKMEVIQITKDTVVGDLLEIDESAGRFLMDIGMHCLSCPMSQGETIEEACEVHDVDPDELVAEINKYLKDKAEGKLDPEDQ